MERGLDPCECLDDITLDEFVIDADDAKANGFEHLLPLPIGAPLFFRLVDIAVDFYDEAFGGAVEVDDEGTDGVLPAKLATEEPAVAQLFPERILTGRAPPPELPRDFKHTTV